MVHVTVTGPGGTSTTSSADEFTYTYLPPAVTQVSTTQATGIYTAGTAIPITVTFSEPVTVTGTPQLALNSGSGAAANYSSGSGTATLTFIYTVAAGQTRFRPGLCLDGGLGAHRRHDPRCGGQRGRVDIAGHAERRPGSPATSPWCRCRTASRAAISARCPGNCRRRARASQLDGRVERGPCGQLRRAIGRDRRVEQQHPERHAHGGGRRILLLAQGRPRPPAAAALIFEIDGVPQLQWSGTTPWQQSFLLGLRRAAHVFLDL